MSYMFTGTKLYVVLTFLIKSSTSAQGQAVELSGSLSLEVEHGRLRYRPLRGSGRSLKRSSARMGTDSPSPPKTTRRKAPLVLCSLSSGMRRTTLRVVSSVQSIVKELKQSRFWTCQDMLVVMTERVCA
jgi:hypothetical protein